MAKKAIKKNLKTLVALAVVGSMVLADGFTAVKASAATNTNTTTVQSTSTKQKRNIGYYCDWSIYSGQGYCNPENIPAKYLTHLNLAFTGVEKDGSLIMLDKDANFGHPLGHSGVTYGDINGGIVNDLQNVRKENPNLKLGFSVGGWSLSGNFTWVARNASARQKFAQEIAQVLDYANFDFIDIDWEYPASQRDPDNVDNKHDQGNPDAIPEDKENYVLMLQEIRNELDKLGEKTGKKYEISIAINMSHAKTDIGIDVPKIFNIIDFANVMTYDAAGAWDSRSGHQTALYDNPNNPNEAFTGTGFSVDSSIQNFLKLGAPADKLVVGAAMYTRGWQKVNNDGPDPVNQPGLFGTAEKVNKDVDLNPTYGADNDTACAVGDGGRKAGNWAWRNREKLLQTYSGLQEYWDDIAKAPYLYSKENGAFFTYDNKRSIAEKTKYVNEHDLGGIITWTVSNDKQTESGQNDDLTKAIYDGLYGSTQLQQYEVKEPQVDATVKLSAGQNSWQSTSLLNINLQNNAKLNGTGSTMVKVAEEAAKTIKNMKMYIKTNGVAITGGQSPAPAVKQENGYYVLDFSDAYDSKLLKAGGSITFDLSLDKLATNPADFVQEIYVTQRMYKGAPEFGKTVLYTGNDKPAQDDKYAAEDFNKDNVVDEKDLALIAGKYNAVKGDSAYDSAYDLNSDNIIDIYDIVKVAAKLGTTTTEPTEPDQPTQPDQPSSNEWDANKAYNQGETVVYKGVTYKAKWYTKGETPGASQWGPWEAQQ